MGATDQILITRVVVIPCSLYTYPLTHSTTGKGSADGRTQRLQVLAATCRARGRHDAEIVRLMMVIGMLIK